MPPAAPATGDPGRGRGAERGERPQVGEKEADAGETGELAVGGTGGGGGVQRGGTELCRGPDKAWKYPDGGALLSLARFLPASLTKLSLCASSKWCNAGSIGF